MSIRLLIADDHAVVRAGITCLLSGSELEVVAQADNGSTAIELARQHQPDLALIAMRLPETDGLACLAKLRIEFPKMPVLMYHERRNLTQLARSVALGAVGSIAKSSSQKELIAALRQGASGESLWSREDLRAVSGPVAGNRLENALDISLTKRESEVLKQLAMGLSNKEIAQALSISYETVKEHVQNVLRKLGVADRTQAAIWAVKNGLA